MSIALRWISRLVVLAGMLATALVLAPRVYADSVVGNGTPASCTEGAFDAALNGGGLITFDCGGPAEIQLGAYKPILLDTGIDGTGLVTITANLSYIFQVQPGRTLTLTNITLADGSSSFAGSIVNSGTITIENSRLLNNHSSDVGGAIANYGTLDVFSSELSGNSAGTWGGAIYNDHGSVRVVDSKLLSNTVSASSGRGGAIANSAGIVSVTGSALDGNRSVSGGAVFNLQGAQTNIFSSTLAANAAWYGGAVENEGFMQIQDSALTSNTSEREGGAIYSIIGQLYLQDTTISDNSAGQIGGGIRTAGTLWATNTTISNNRSTGNGGGVYIEADAQFVNSTISGNQASGSSDGGGIFQGNGNAILQSVTVANNSAAFGAGIMRQASIGSVTLSNSLLSNNTTQNCYGLLTSLGHNISSDAYCGAAFTQAGDLNGIRTILGPLTDNGGPTQTHMPLHGSPAIDSGSPAACPATDQRGVARPLGSACDVGAVESNRGHQISLPVLTR